MFRLAAVGQAGRQQGIGHRTARGNPHPAVVQIRTCAAHRPEKFVGQRLVDHACNHLPVFFMSDGDREVRYAVQEIGRAVERVDDPAVVSGGVGVRSGQAPALLHRQPETGPALAQFVQQGLLGPEVGGADEIRWPLARDLELFDLAEVAHQGPGGLARRAFHDIDDGGFQGHGSRPALAS